MSEVQKKTAKKVKTTEAPAPTPVPAPAPVSTPGPVEVTEKLNRYDNAIKYLMDKGIDLPKEFFKRLPRTSVWSAASQKPKDLPKKARSAYIIFCDKMRVELLAKDSTRKISFKELADMWKALSVEGRSVYETEAAADKKRQESEKAVYDLAHPAPVKASRAKKITSTTEPEAPVPAVTVPKVRVKKAVAVTA